MIKGILGWMWSNKNVAGYIILAVLIAYLTWDRNRIDEKNRTMEIEAGKLPDTIEFLASMHGTKFAITYRDSKNNVVHKEYYVPEEGGIDITKKISLKNYDPNTPLAAAVAAGKKIPSINPLNKLLDKVFGPVVEPGKDTDIKIRTRGFTFKPGIAGIWDGGYNQSRPVTVGLDAKLFYMGRYSGGIGSSIDYPYVFVSRHIDDIIPVIKVSHLELQVIYGKPYAEFDTSVIGAGGRVNF